MGRKTTLAWAAAAFVPAAVAAQQKMVYLHLHKAGGSTMCQTLKKAGLRTAPGNCNCVEPHFDWGDAQAAWERMERDQLDVCFVEAVCLPTRPGGVRCHFESEKGASLSRRRRRRRRRSTSLRSRTGRRPTCSEASATRGRGTSA